MKPTAVIFFTFFISLATAIPVAEVERQIFGRNLQSVPSSYETSKRLSKRPYNGPKKRPQIIDRTPSPPNYGRYIGDDEPDRDYQTIVKTIPKYPLGWQGERQSTPPDRETGFVVRNPKKVDYYYGKETEYTSDGWDKLTRIYPEYSNHGFSKRPKANIRPSKGGNSVRPETLGGIDSEDEWDREEEPPNGFDYPQGRYIVHRAPRIESKYQSTMFTQASSRVDSDAKHHFHSNYKNNPADTVIVRGPSDPFVDGGRTPRYAIPRSRNRDIDAILYPEDRPVLRGERGGSQDPQIITVAPNSKRGGRTRYTSSQKKREVQSSTTSPTSVDEITERDIIGTISGDEGNANSSSRAEQVAQIQDYLWAFDEARQNASDLLYPFLVDVLNGTNGYVGEMIAWGLWSMIWPDSIIDGAFRMGFSSFGMDASNFTGPYAQALSDWSYAVEEYYFDIYAEAEEAV